MSTNITIMPNVIIITQTEGHTDLESPQIDRKIDRLMDTDRQTNGQRYTDKRTER